MAWLLLLVTKPATVPMAAWRDCLLPCLTSAPIEMRSLSRQETRRVETQIRSIVWVRLPTLELTKCRHVHPNNKQSFFHPVTMPVEGSACHQKLFGPRDRRAPVDSHRSQTYQCGWN